MDEKYIDIDLFKKQIFKNESFNLMTWMIEPNFDCVYMFCLYIFRKKPFHTMGDNSEVLTPNSRRYELRPRVSIV